jgi:hypothetical protein
MLSHAGKEAVVAVLDAGSFFGEGCLTSAGVCVSGSPSVEESAAAQCQYHKHDNDQCRRVHL